MTAPEMTAPEMTTAKVAATAVTDSTMTESECCTRHGDANRYRQCSANHQTLHKRSSSPRRTIAAGPCQRYRARYDLYL
jgi:hypothetical protein